MNSKIYNVDIRNYEVYDHRYYFSYAILENTVEIVNLIEKKHCILI